MKTVIQRVKSASVTVDNVRISEISKGYLILLGIEQGDTEADLKALAAKVSKLRIFADADDKMNLSIRDIGGEILLVSQFTLCAQCKHGNRPAFVSAMAPKEADRMYQAFGKLLEEAGIPVKYGQFAAMMDVALVNDGPVTIIMEARNGVILY